MSVIAKMVVRNSHVFGVGSLAELSCLCDNDLMAEYATSEEDKLFTRYSPWGEIKLHLDSGWSLQQDQKYYVMVLAKDEIGESPKGAALFCELRVCSVTDFGDGQARRLEMSDGWNKKNLPRRGIDHFNWKMSVDNPPVFDQLKAGSNDYWIAFYREELGRDGTIQLAHSLND